MRPLICLAIAVCSSFSLPVTPGECSLMVRLSNRNVLLTGDTVHLREAIDREATMPLGTDPNQSTHSIRRLRVIREMYDATLWITHDPED